MSHTLPALAYAYDALEPHIDALTMEIHHSRHHQTYINNLNAALADLPELAALPVEELLARFDSLPGKVQGAASWLRRSNETWADWRPSNRPLPRRR